MGQPITDEGQGLLLRAAPEALPPFYGVTDPRWPLQYPGSGSLDGIEIVGVPKMDDLPPLRPPAIEDVVRQGGKLILSGDSKAGKTFLLIELAAAFAFERTWCGLGCAKSRVLYVNLELSEGEFLHRFRGVLDKMGLTGGVGEDQIGILNARGKAANAEGLTNALLRRLSASSYDVIIIDPIYKIQDGDENSARAITALVQSLDRLAEGAQCTIVYSHHHPKHLQGGTAAINRSAGSGVFGRDTDASIDLSELDASGIEGAPGRAFRMEFDLRSFPGHAPVDIWFRDGLHVVDDAKMLGGCLYANRSRASSRNSGGRKKLVKLESVLDELMGERDEIDIKTVRTEINNKDSACYISECKDNRTIRRALERSDRFEYAETGPSSSVIRRKRA